MCTTTPKKCHHLAAWMQWCLPLHSKQCGLRSFWLVYITENCTPRRRLTVSCLSKQEIERGESLCLINWWLLRSVSAHDQSATPKRCKGCWDVPWKQSGVPGQGDTWCRGALSCALNRCYSIILPVICCTKAIGQTTEYFLQYVDQPIWACMRAANVQSAAERNLAQAQKARRRVQESASLTHFAKLIKR